jgi:hypothetical protein
MLRRLAFCRCRPSHGDAVNTAMGQSVPIRLGAWAAVANLIALCFFASVWLYLVVHGGF